MPSGHYLLETKTSKRIECCGNAEHVARLQFTALLTKSETKERIMALPIGTEVFWYSQASGSRVVKTGKIVEIVPIGERPSEQYLSQLKEAGWGRKEVSYVVAVKQQDNRKDKVYWPRTQWLLTKKTMPTKKAV